LADAQQPADELKQKHWAGYKTKITDGNWDLTIRYSASGEKYFAVLSSPSAAVARCEGAVDERGNLERVDCTPDLGVWVTRYLAGNVSQIELLNPESGSDGGAVFVDKKLAQRIKAGAGGRRVAAQKSQKSSESAKKLASLNPSKQLERGSFPYDGVWEGGKKLCGKWHGGSVDYPENTVYVATKLIIKNGQPKLGAKIYVDLTHYNTHRYGTGISTLRLPYSYQLTWYLKEILDQSNRSEPLLFWKLSTDNHTSPYIVKVQFSRPTNPTDPIMLQVSGARECEIKFSQDLEETKLVKVEAKRQRIAEATAEKAEKKRKPELARKKAVAEKKRLARLKAEAEKQRLAELARKKAAAEKARKLAEAKAEAEKQRLAELARKAENQRLAELARKKAAAEKTRKLAEAKAAAEEKRIAELARKKAEEAEKARKLAEAKAVAEEQRLAELARKKAEEAERKHKANAPDRKLFAKLAPGAKTYLDDVMAFLQNNPDAPILLDASLAVASLDESLSAESGKKVEASLEELQQVVANSDDFAKHKARLAANRKQQQMNRRAEAIAYLKTHKKFLSKLLVRSLSKKDGTTKALASMITTAKAGLMAEGPGQAAAALRAIKKQIKADAKINKTYRQAKAYLKAEKQRQAELTSKKTEEGKAKKRQAELSRKKAEEAERKLAEARGTEQNKLASAVPSIEFGDYHALVIGNNDYVHLPKLKNAVGDAKDVSSVLQRMYNFEVTTLLNANRSDIFGALVELRAELTWGSNLLIYYAGHGIVDEYTGVGFWQPVDAAEEDPSNWISNSDITNMLNAIGAKHVMIIADSCYSGTLVRSSGKGLRTAKDLDVWLKRMSQKRSRTALVSGGIEPVMDGGGGKNSVFAKALLDVLKENRSVIDGAAVFESLKRRVVLGSDQTPEYSDIRKAEHDGGDFLLVRRGGFTEQPSVSEGADPLEKIENKCAALGFTKGAVEHGQCVMKLYK